MLAGAIFNRVWQAAAGSRKLTGVWPGDDNRPDNEQED
jgi:hypothetical protein